MPIRVHLPSPPLSRSIESMTLVVDAGYPHEREWLFPDGAVDLLVNLGPHEHRAVLPGESSPRSYHRAWLSGERRGPLLIERARHGIHLLHIRFHPGGASAIFGFDLSEMTDRVVELEEIWGLVAVEEIAERTATLSDTEDLFAGIEQLLRDRLLEDRPTRLVTGALRLLQESDLEIGIRDLAARLGASHTRLIETFRRDVGLRPKTLQRILRLQRAIRLEDARPRLDWTTIAYRCGYSDQSHLIRDFRHFSGITPTTYRSNRAEFPNYVPVDPGRD